MRHLVGVLLAVVLAAAVFFAASWGYLKLFTLPLSLPVSTGSLLHHTAILEGLGALAGRKALLLPWVTLLSEGRNLGTAIAATSQAAMMTQRNLTANAPISPKMA